MVQYKLYYFNARGAGELARILFKAAGVEFEDVRYTREEWPSHKKDMPLGALPVLEVNGVKYCQGAAIARYLAREFGFFGSSSLDELRINEIQEVCAEMLQREVMKIFMEQDATEKAKMAKAFCEGSLQTYFKFFETRLRENNGGKGFYISDKLSLADLVVYNNLTMIDEFMKKLGADTKLSSCTVLNDLIKRVEAIPKIAKWIQERPVTDH